MYIFDAQKDLTRVICGRRTWCGCCHMHDALNEKFLLRRLPHTYVLSLHIDMSALRVCQNWNWIVRIDILFFSSHCVISFFAVDVAAHLFLFRRSQFQFHTWKTIKRTKCVNIYCRFSKRMNGILKFLKLLVHGISFDCCVYMVRCGVVVKSFLQINFRSTIIIDVWIW